MSRTLVLMFGVGLWMVSPGRAADNPDNLNMPRNVAGAEPAGTIAAEPCGTCATHHCRLRGCLGHLREWLCYRDTQEPIKCCGCGSSPCCHPQLHTYFLEHCRACAHDDEPGIPITFSYTDLLDRNGDVLGCQGGGCGGCGGCRGCK
jgi:hypothetical protein